MRCQQPARGLLSLKPEQDRHFDAAGSQLLRLRKIIG
jgi:hypothetical protein